MEKKTITHNFETTVLKLKDIRRLFVQYLSLREIWNLDEAYIGYFLADAKFSASTDTLDSFFECDEFDSLLFLRWCDENNIVVKRLFLCVSSDDSTKYSLDLLNALESYLKKMGSKVIAISFKFAFNCIITAQGLITLAFQHCPNLVLFSLDGGLLNFSKFQIDAILIEARKCHSIRDWVFVGFNPLVDSKSYTNEFCRMLHDALGGDDAVHELFVSRKQKQLQACQYTFIVLEAMDNKLRITFIDSNRCALFHDNFLGMRTKVSFPLMIYQYG